jgi:hypothetical protein
MIRRVKSPFFFSKRLQPSMGFENRRSLRVKIDQKVHFWPGAAAEGAGAWGQTLNLSATGMAFHAPQGAEKGTRILLEMSLPGQKRSLHLPAEVIFCERDFAGERHYQMRVSFLELEAEDRQNLRLYVLQVAEPNMGWGRGYFPGQPAVDIKYRELPAADREQWMQSRAYLTMKELTYLKNFQMVLERRLGTKAPDSLKLVGSRPLKEHSDVWMELDLPHGQLHFLAKTLWCGQEPGEKAQCGLGLSAFHKDEAMKLEKEPG